MPFTKIYANEKYGKSHVLVVLLKSGLLIQWGQMLDGSFIGDETCTRSWDFEEHPHFAGLWDGDEADEGAIWNVIEIEHYL